MHFAVTTAKQTLKYTLDCGDKRLRFANPTSDVLKSEDNEVKNCRKCG